MYTCAARLNVAKTVRYLYVVANCYESTWFGYHLWVLMLVSECPNVLSHGDDLLKVWEFSNTWNN